MFKVKEEGAAAPFFIGREKAKETAGALRFPPPPPGKGWFFGGGREAHPPPGAGFMVFFGGGGEGTPPPLFTIYAAGAPPHRDVR
ncbi:hypothetical protein B8W51_04865, partial [Cronobacter sakazakii]